MNKYLVLVLFTLSIYTVAGQNYLKRDPAERLAALNYGGRLGLKSLLKNEMNYPESELKNKIEGKVVLSFIVDKETGIPRDLKVVKSVSKELDNEAIRLHNMLLYLPAYFKEDHYNTLTIKFSTKAYKKYCKKRGYKAIDLENPGIDYSNKIYRDNELTTKPKAIFSDSLETIGRFTYRNLQYPSGTLKLNITGTVKLSFVIEPTGRITNIRILKGLGGGATDEAKRILRLIKWQAGMVDSKKVRASKQFEVNFDLSNSSGVEYVPNGTL